jgi:UDP-N-acetylmuramyl tripeptide synthase
MILSAKVQAARAVGALARRLGRGGGTSLPGKVLMRLAPGAIGELGGRLRRGSVIISATNGKTTSAAMAASVLERGGAKLVHNRAGANMAGGIASTLLDASGRGRTIAGDLGLFEVDEFWLDRLARELDPRVLLLSNLFRDQLDRYGELETIADRWEQVVAARAGRSKFVLNADDPLVADLGRERPGVVYFGVEDTSMALPGLQHASDSKHCRRCGAPYVYDAAFMGHLGHYHCENCGRRRPEPDVAAEKVVLHGTRSASVRLRTPQGTVEVDLPLPGLYNVYNALGAAALCLALDVPLDDVVAGLQTVAAAFGRAETLQVGDRALSILLVKNPAGANEVLRTLALEDGDLDLFAILNDNTADGHDISWIWDADFEVIAERARRITCSGVRAHELALRLKYAGVPRDRLNVVPDPSAGLDAALADGTGPLFALPTYTALLGLRDELADRGAAARFWEPAA